MNSDRELSRYLPVRDICIKEESTIAISNYGLVCSIPSIRPRSFMWVAVMDVELYLKKNYPIRQH